MNIRYVSAAVMQGAAEVMAYGTAEKQEGAGIRRLRLFLRFLS